MRHPRQTIWANHDTDIMSSAYPKRALCCHLHTLSSLCQHPSIDIIDPTRDTARFLAEQVGYKMGDLFRSALPLHRHKNVEDLLMALILECRVVKQRCIHKAATLESISDG